MFYLQVGASLFVAFLFWGIPRNVKAWRAEKAVGNGLEGLYGPRMSRESGTVVANARTRSSDAMDSVFYRCLFGIPLAGFVIFTIFRPDYFIF